MAIVEVPCNIDYCYSITLNFRNLCVLKIIMHSGYIGECWDSYSLSLTITISWLIICVWAGHYKHIKYCVYIHQWVAYIVLRSHCLCGVLLSSISVGDCCIRRWYCVIDDGSTVMIAGLIVAESTVSPSALVRFAALMKNAYLNQELSLPKQSTCLQ